MLEFVWDVAVGGFDAKETIQVRFDNAVSQGVPLPQTWKTAIRCAKQLASKACASASKARDDIFVDAVECELLGRPRHAPPPDHHRASGALVPLWHGDGQQEFLLAAYIEGAKWLVHAGGDPDDPFNVNGLLVKDIARDATQKKKRRKRSKTADLRTTAMSNAEAWLSCVARATWQAEVLRATRRAFNMEIAAAGFEQNPFKWTGDRLSHAEVTFAWS